MGGGSYDYIASSTRSRSVDSFLIAINNNLNLKFSRNIYSYSE